MKRSFLTTEILCMQVFGLMTKPIVRFFLPCSKYIPSLSSEPSTPNFKSLTLPLLGNYEDDTEANYESSQYDIPHPTSLRMLLSKPSHTVHHYWRKFDNCFMRPVFGGRGFVPFLTSSPTDSH